MISTRHVRALLAILGLALIPLLAERIEPRRHDDCRRPDMLNLTLAIPGSTPQQRTDRLEEQAEDSRRAGLLQWTRGTVKNPEEPDAPLRFWIVRSFDPLRASPRWVLDGVFDPESNELRHVETEAGTLPIRVAVDRTRRPSRLVAWAWIYDGAPATQVFPSLLRAAPRRLLTGATPVTLLMVDGKAGGKDGGVQHVAERWLADAWTHVDRFCR